MTPEQLYVIFFSIIGMYIVISALDIGLTSASSKKTGSFVNGADIWTKVIFGMLSGLGIIYFVNTASSGGSSSANTISRNIYRGAN